MSYPRLGMFYEDVRKRVKRIEREDKRGKVKDKATKSRLVDSLINQAKLHEGDGVISELKKEIDPNNYLSNKVAYSGKYADRYEEIDWNN